MKSTATLPKYRQPQLDDNRSLAEQLSASSPASSRTPVPLRGQGKVVPLKRPEAKRATGFFDAVPGANIETALLLFGVVALGIAIGVPLGAWMFVSAAVG
ncbi:hypothetical protein OU800_23240 [Pseudomonas sp. GOM7]|uniref:hypothetical protein n=1 Tax=unclassified Pseudomonas TaxID=196821 RepID=UPI00227AA7C3|nr:MULTISPECIES: hypothetical protein [unclassified Pseudomonas]WAJ37478.1 hypothetical protein OU800_23240 [Pseudomonas sp. GOM7]